VRIATLLWDEDSVEHVAKHGLHPDEVEDACRLHPWLLRGRQGFYNVLGLTSAGRYLVVVLLKRGQQWKVVTARDMDGAERRRYLQR